jgi:hypothetical protein
MSADDAVVEEMIQCEITSEMIASMPVKSSFEI